MIRRRLFLFTAAGTALLPAPLLARLRPSPEWLAGPVLDRLADRFPPPAGFQRLAVSAASFGHWLRQLPLRPPGEVVRFFDGRVKPDQSGVAAVVDIDIGRTDLQQCADAIIRLRAEYLRAVDRDADIAFRFTSGDRYTYAAWRAGRRPMVNGNSVSWISVGARPDSRAGFRSWLDIIFAYAGTISLQRELERVRDPGTVTPGDVLIQPGAPGHAVLVVDVVAAPATGERLALLAQSFMPAQNIHVLTNPAGGVWYRLAAVREIATPEWRFAPADLRRFPE